MYKYIIISDKDYIGKVLGQSHFIHLVPTMYQLVVMGYFR